MENNCIVVGLTGQTGAGKSTVSRLLSSRGYRVIDADIVARQVVQKGNECLLELALEFGTRILDAEGNLNRRKLGAMVFADRAKRQRLNQITFPYIQEEIRTQLEALRRSGEPVVFLDAPTLFESGSDRFCDKVVSVVAKKSLRLARILARDKITEQEAENRIASQFDDEYYQSRSDFTIRNDSDLTALRIQVLEMLDICCNGARPPAAPESN